MAAVDIPVTNPHFSASAQVSDQSKTDESIQTSHTTVNVGEGGVIQQHCGNQKTEDKFTRIMSTFLILFISLICDAFILFFLWQGQKYTQRSLAEQQKNIIEKFDKFEQNAQETHKRLEDAQKRQEDAQKRQEERH